MKTNYYKYIKETLIGHGVPEGHLSFKSVDKIEGINKALLEACKEACTYVNEIFADEYGEKIADKLRKAINQAEGK